jgi:hypothetical protein
VGITPEDPQKQNPHRRRRGCLRTACKHKGPPCCRHALPEAFGIVPTRHRLGRVIGEWQWRAADRRCASRCGHSSRRACGLGVAFVGALCQRINSQDVDPRDHRIGKISSPGVAGCPVRPIDASAGFAGGVRRNHFPNPAKSA